MLFLITVSQLTSRDRSFDYAPIQSTGHHVLLLPSDMVSSRLFHGDSKKVPNEGGKQHCLFPLGSSSHLEKKIGFTVLETLPLTRIIFLFVCVCQWVHGTDCGIWIEIRFRLEFTHAIYVSVNIHSQYCRKQGVELSIARNQLSLNVLNDPGTHFPTIDAENVPCLRQRPLLDVNLDGATPQPRRMNRLATRLASFTLLVLFISAIAWEIVVPLLPQRY